MEFKHTIRCQCNFAVGPSPCFNAQAGCDVICWFDMLSFDASQIPTGSFGRRVDRYLRIAIDDGDVRA